MLKKVVYSCITPYGVEVDKESDKKIEDFGWEDSIVDLTDFVPLAELVRSFQPRDNMVEPEFEYPDGNEGSDANTWEPPHDYSDITDASLAVREKSLELSEKLAQRRSRSSESKSEPSEQYQLNSDSADSKLSQAIESSTKQNNSTKD